MYHISLTISLQASPEKRARKMNEHYIRQRGSLQEKEAVERMIASINLLPQTTGSAECTDQEML